MISISFFADLCFNVFRDCLTYVSAVGIRNLILFVKEVGKPLAVVNGGGCYRVICDDFGIRVNLCMILVAVMGLVILLCPTGVRVLLCQLMLGFWSVFFPFFGHFSGFDRLVFLPRISLTGRVYKCRINDCSGVCDDSILFKLFVIVDK